MKTKKRVTTTTVTVEEVVDAPRKTLVTFLLDRTGSMANNKAETIGGFNAYLDSMQAEAGELVEFTLLQFDSQSIDKLCVGVPLNQVKRLTNENFIPRAYTPLIDACYDTIVATEQVAANRVAENPRVVIVFMTDGDENASRRHKRSDLVALIERKQRDGWQFLYMGAGINAYGEAASFGISHASTVSYDVRNSNAAFAASASNTASFALGLSSSTSYSVGQKIASGDVHQADSSAHQS